MLRLWPRDAMQSAPTPACADRLTWHHLRQAASTPYRRAGRFAWHFAQAKLGFDPVFRQLVCEGLIPSGSRVLDLGCGQGLLGSVLLSAPRLDAAGIPWPAHWAPAPRGLRITGIELMPREVERARLALGDSARFVCADLRDAELPDCDAVVILDVLHYLDPADQDRLLERVRDALVPGGRLLLRVADARHRFGYTSAMWGDWLVSRLRGHRVPTRGHTVSHWLQKLHALGFDVDTRPMNGRRMPFSNVLLVGRRDPATTTSLPQEAIA